jgi:TRAP-type C4-dicarboxylate transport system permease small subunit
MNMHYKTLTRAIDAMDNIALFIACMMLFALMALVVTDVALRYLFNSPVAWSYEVISRILMPGLFFLAVAHTQRSHGHVAVDILHNYVNDHTRYILASISSVLVTPVFGYIAWITGVDTIQQFQSGAVLSDGLELPAWSTTVLMPIGFTLLTICCFLNSVGYLSTLASGQSWISLPPISGTEEQPK